MVAVQLKYESNWAESYIYVNHLYRPFVWESLRDFIFSRPNDDSRYLQRTALKQLQLVNTTYPQLWRYSTKVNAKKTLFSSDLIESESFVTKHNLLLLGWVVIGELFELRTRHVISDCQRIVQKWQKWQNTVFCLSSVTKHNLLLFCWLVIGEIFEM